MAERFPASHAHGVEWYQCIDTSRFDERDTAMSIFSQLANSTHWPHALGVLQIPSSNVELKHIGTMLYCTSERAIKRGWDTLEAARLNAALKDVVEQLQRENPSETHAIAADIVQSAASRA